MITIQYALIFSSCLITLLGFLLLRPSLMSTEKSPSHTICTIIHDGLTAVCKRQVSGILQMGVYLFFLFFIASLSLDFKLEWRYVVSFFLGSGYMISLLLVYAFLAPKTVPTVIKNSGYYFHPCIRSHILSSYGLGFIAFGLFMLIFTLSFIYLGTLSVISVGLGITLSGFFLRMSGGLFRSSATISADLVSQTHPNIHRMDRRNPGSLLDIIGDYFGTIVGYSSDIISSFLFTLIACILFPTVLESRGIMSNSIANQWVGLPLIILIISGVSSLVSLLFILFRIRTNKTQNVLLEGLYVSLILCGISVYFLSTKGEFFSFVSELSTDNLYPFYAYNGLDRGLYYQFLIRGFNIFQVLSNKTFSKIYRAWQCDQYFQCNVSGTH